MVRIVEFTNEKGKRELTRWGNEGNDHTDDEDDDDEDDDDVDVDEADYSGGDGFLSYAISHPISLYLGNLDQWDVTVAEPISQMLLRLSLVSHWIIAILLTYTGSS